MKIVEANFIRSSTSSRDALPPDMMEVAFLGRSNVGKSSIINAITDRKGLAKSSQTPGKTRLINFFNVTFAEDKERFKARFVDLPGIGYAKVSRHELETWQKNLASFLRNRECLRALVLLVDARHPDLEIDRQSEDFAVSLQKSDMVILTIFTKVDKLNQKELTALKKAYPDSLMVSSTSKSGIEEARATIFEVLFKADIPDSHDDDDDDNDEIQP